MEENEEGKRILRGQIRTPPDRNSTRPQLFCLWLRHLRDRGEILITKFPKFLEETKKEKEERGKKEKVEEKEEEKRILRNKKRIRVHEYLERTSFL